MRIELSLVVPVQQFGTPAATPGPRFAELLEAPPVPSPLKAPPMDLQLENPTPPSPQTPIMPTSEDTSPADIAEPRPSPQIRPALPDLRPTGDEERPPWPQVTAPSSDLTSAERLEPSPSPPERPEQPDLAEPFEAFGMFGRRPVVVTDADVLEVIETFIAPSPPASGIPSPVPVLALPHTTNAPQDHQPSGIEILVTAKSAGPTPVASRMRPSSMSASSADVPASPTPADVEAEPLSAAPSRRQRTLPAPNTPPQDQVVLLNHNPDAAQVAVRAAGVSQAEVQQFRARARDLFRDHGLSLDKLSVNGEDRTGSASPERKTQSWR